ncbi:Nuclear factor NF-kappa-B p105 subunit [Mactra antiquata]
MMEDSGDSRSSGGSNDMDSPQITNGVMDTDHLSDEDNGQPYIEITEQPQQRGFRFRYECEGPSHGGLQGANSEKIRKTVPTVKIRNYSGAAKIVATLVTDEPVPKAHAHKLVGKNCSDGICQVDVKAGTPQIQFPSLCIQHVTRRKAAEVLEERIKNSITEGKQRSSRDWTLNIKLTDEEKKRARQEAQNQAKGMQLNVVRLCFQCYLVDNDQNIQHALSSVVSDPIYDSKAPGANALKICRMDKYSGCCTGNDEVFLLCEKVQKDDIQVRFLELDQDGSPVWQGFGQFGPFDVHRQFAIVFKTPEYRDVNIQSPVNVLVMLQRKSDGESSDPKSFTYYPRIKDKEDIARKRRKLLPNYPNNFNNTNSSYGGNGNNNGSNGGSGTGGGGGDSSNGLQNGTGAIPDFSNLQRSLQFGQRPLSLIGTTDNSRQILQAKRTQATFQHHQTSPQYTEATVDIMSDPSKFIYEEVNLSLSPPCNVEQLQNAVANQYFNEPSPQMIGVTSPSNSSMSAASPYNGSMTLGSPQNNGQTLSSMTLGSPQNSGQTLNSGGQYGAISSQMHLDPHSPQNVHVQQIVSQHQSIPMVDTQMHANLQMTLSDVKSEQPVQVSSMPSDNVEADFLWPNQQLNTDMFDQYNANASRIMEDKNFVFDTQSALSLKNVDQQMGQFQQHYGMQSCAYQARSPRGCDTDLQDIIDVLDMVDGAPPRSDPCEGYDEVDHVGPRGGPRGYDMMELVSRSAGSGGVINQTAKLEPSLGKAVPVSEEGSSDLPLTVTLSEKTGTSVSSPTITGREPVLKKVASTDSSVQVESVETTEISVQTDMDPMMKLAMKTSQALQFYAASGDIRSLLMVQRFLMAVHDPDGDLPLHTALINQRYVVFQNILDVMVTLPDAYTRINAYNFHYQTPLHLAVITNQPDAVDLLIRAGADTTIVDRNGYTPAHLAVLYGNIECLKNLVKYLRNSVSAKQPFPELNVRCYEGFTPAHLAAQLENLSAMKLLVYGKADVNLADGKSGRTPLHHAVEVDDLSVAAYLILQAGANVNEKRFDGNTALHIACGRGNVGMVALLMAGGADPNAENDDIVSEEDNESEEAGDNDNDNDAAVDDDEPTNISTDDVDVKDAGTEKEEKNIKADVDNDEKDDEVKSRPRRGLTPADFADSNTKVLRVLNGEPYSSITGSTYNNDVEHTTDKLASLRFVSHDSGKGSMASNSDMDKVDYPTRVMLSQLLDKKQTGSDCYTLADRLGLKHLNMEGVSASASPTRFLLTLFEENGGTVSKLTQVLSELNREDCVSLLKPFVDESREKYDDKKTLPKDPTFDSGISDTCTTKSSSSSPPSIYSKTCFT